LLITMLVGFARAAINPPVEFEDTPVKPEDRLRIENHSGEWLVVWVRTPDPLGGPDEWTELAVLAPYSQKTEDVDGYGFAECSAACTLTVEAP
jgi:hypothetical protein